MSAMNLNVLETPQVDTLILADRAEVLNSKLYMMGGGWDRLYVVDFTRPHALSIAVGVLVPWSATNREHRLAIRIESQDNDELANLALGFNAGRPTQLKNAQSQRVLLAFQAEMVIRGPGTYLVRAIIDEHESKSIEFHAEHASVI